ncbi:MAG: hypothetical protein LBE80_04690 [Deltaproteobacteria bacterium]|jgi:hypothetical protein|nr:hypothetical protein [Deltaproteobacteria bacterium]
MDMNVAGPKSYLNPPKKNKIFLFVIYFGLLGLVILGGALWWFFSGSFGDNPARGTWKISRSGFGYIFPITADENVIVKITNHQLIFLQDKTRQEVEVEFKEVDGKWFMYLGGDEVELVFNEEGKLVIGDEKYFNLVLDKAKD